MNNLIHNNTYSELLKDNSFAYHIICNYVIKVCTVIMTICLNYKLLLVFKGEFGNVFIFCILLNYAID